MRSLTILAALCLAQPSNGGARRGTPEWRAMNRRVAHDRVRAQYLRDEEVSLLKGLTNIERRIRQRNKEKKRLQRRLSTLEARLDRLQSRRGISRTQLEGLRVIAGQRAAAMLRLRQASVGRMMARIVDPQGQYDPVAARQLRDRFRFAFSYDRGLLTEARTVDASVREIEDALLEERAQRATARAQLESEIQESELLKEERRALLEAVRTERKAAERMVRELAKAAHQLGDEMGRIHGRRPAPESVPGGFRAQKGRLPWPTAGRVEVTFGKRVDPRSDVVLVSNGIDIRARQNEPVRAVFGGKVAFADRFEGYGNMVVLAHDGGYFTVYAHLESFGGTVGGGMAQHQVLGFVGDTGSTKGPYLYFEVRHGRKPIDPLRWLVDDT